MNVVAWRRLAVVACLGAAIFGTAACGSDDSKTSTAAGSDAELSDLSDLSDATDADDDTLVGKAEFGPDDDDLIIEATIAEVEAFWTEFYPELYGDDYTPLSGGAYAYGPRNPPPDCGAPGEADYDDVAENAFYCPPDDFVAWDTDNLTNGLLDDFGPFNLAIVVAHEMGHKVQGDHGILDGSYPTFLTEQQADCFAGAFTAYAADGNSELFDEVTLDDLSNALGGFLQIRDPVGTDYADDPSAHGSAFQRINAFEDGLFEGLEKCKAYEDGEFTVVPEVFTSEEDFATGGNLPLEDLEPLMIDNLNGFWTAAFADLEEVWTAPTVNAYDPADGVECDGERIEGRKARGLAFYCEADDSVNWDDVRLMPQLHSTIGDLAAAVVIANLYSERAQIEAGLERGGLDANLQIDCFTGVWVATTATAELTADVTLSPGDLDEAVAAFLQFQSKGDGTETQSSDEVGTAFERLDSFRAGFLTAYTNGYIEGLEVCVGGGGADAAESESR